MFLKKDKQKSKYRHLLKQGLAVVLCIASLCSFMFGFSEIDAFAADCTNTMMLHITTGNIAGDRVQYFKVRYKDTSGIEHTQIVHPKDAKTTTFGKILNEKSGVYSTYQKLSESLSKMTGGCNLCDYSYEALRQYTEDYLIFETDFTFSSLLYIEVFVNYSSNSATGKNEWTCQNLELIKLKSLNDFTFAGVISGEPIPDYEGTVVARKTKASPFAWAVSANDTVYRLSFTSTDDNTKLSVPTKTSVSTSDYRYSLEIDIADVNGAGLEDCISPVKITNLSDILGLGIIDEHIILSLTYSNDCGGTSTVEIPLLLSYLFSIYRQNEKSSFLTSTTPVDAVFRQGGTIGLTCLLPNISEPSTEESVISFSMKYVDDNKACSGLIKFYTSRTYTRKRMFDDDSFRVGALRIYKATSSALTYSYDSSTSTITHNSMGSEPVWAYVSATSSGLEIKSGSTNSGTAAVNEGGTAKQVPKNVYVVSFTTDTVKGSETQSVVKVTIKYTQKGTGAELTTSAVNLRSEAATYYGYWTAANKVVDTTDNTKYNTEYQAIGNAFEYLYGLSQGNTISFFIQIENVDSFKSVDVEVDGTDDWQIKKIQISKAKDFGERIFTWKDTDTINCTAENSTTKYDFYSDRIITRRFSSEPVSCAEYTQQVLITGGHTATIDFSSGKVGDSDNEESYSHSTNFISYENTKKNFGFAKTRCKYKVGVQVAGDLNTGANYGDCGSVNQFYFQLVFENGKSAYVLANQQLSADGFRTNTMEEFTICTNRNYGELKAIHIIPEDPNSDEDDFDKLKISYIKVSKIDTTGLNHVWKVEINDWISIDYEDDDENMGYKGQHGRTEAELARTYIVTSNTFQASFMMAITTANVDVGTKQLSGNISGTITYIDTTNIERTADLKDITTDIYNYNGKSVDKKITVGTKEIAAVDQSYMALPGHTDRFYFSIDSVKKIESITLKVQSDKDVQWEISGISVFLVKSEGNVIFNDYGEYVNTGNSEFICSWPTEGSLNNSNTVLTIKDGKGSVTSSKIVFSDNLISIENEGDEYTTSITSEPQSQDDSINVYVYMADGSQSVAEYNMVGAVQYTSGDKTDPMQKSIRLNADSTNNTFYKIGISTPGLASVKKMNLQAANSKSAKVDYAIVEHMRSGVLIETIKFTYAQGNAKNVLSAEGLTVPIRSCEEQIITFQTTDDSDTINLTEDIDDIAVSITYESANGTYSNTVTSVNTFLTDHGVSVIQPGRIYNVALYQYHIKSIKSINFIAMGKVIGSVGIRNAYVTNKKYGTTTITNWSSFGKGIKPLSATTRSIAVTDTGDEEGTVVSKITMNIKTAESTTEFDSGTNSKIRMRLGYYDPSDQIHYLVVENIRPYITEGSTFAGKTATFTILVSNLKSLCSVEFTPVAVSVGEDASWTLESITSTILYQGVENSSTRVVNASADEGETISVNIREVEIVIPASSYDPETKSAVNNTFTNKATNSQGMVITGDRTITFSPEVTGSSKGVTVHCYRVVNNADIAFDEILTITKKDGMVSSVLFDPLKVSNYTGYFKIVFQSEEFSQYSVTLHITVEESTFVVVDNSLGKRIIGTSSKNPTLTIYTTERIKLYPKVFGANKNVTYKCLKTVDGNDVLVSNAVTKINEGSADEYINFDPSINPNCEGKYKIVFTVEGDSSITATVPITVKTVETTTAAS